MQATLNNLCQADACLPLLPNHQPLLLNITAGYTSLNFSGFSVDSYINKEEVCYLMLLSLENNLLMYQLHASIIMMSKMKKCEWNLLLIDMHYWIQIIEGCLLITAGPVTKDFQSFISVEELLWGCHLDVQGLLHHNSSFPLPRSDSYYGFLPERWWFSHACLLQPTSHSSPS